MLTDSSPLILAWFWIIQCENSEWNCRYRTTAWATDGRRLNECCPCRWIVHNAKLFEIVIRRAVLWVSFSDFCCPMIYCPSRSFFRADKRWSNSALGVFLNGFSKFLQEFARAQIGCIIRFNLNMWQFCLIREATWILYFSSRASNHTAGPLSLNCIGMHAVENMFGLVRMRYKLKHNVTACLRALSWSVMMATILKATELISPVQRDYSIALSKLFHSTGMTERTSTQSMFSGGCTWWARLRCSCHTSRRRVDLGADFAWVQSDGKLFH